MIKEEAALKCGVGRGQAEVQGIPGNPGSRSGLSESGGGAGVCGVFRSGVPASEDAAAEGWGRNTVQCV